MRVRTARQGVSYGEVEDLPRPVARFKRSLTTSLCAGWSPSYAYVRRTEGSYQFAPGCFCLSPEHHAVQFQIEDWTGWTFRGEC
jgi:hypothetical protein